MKIPANYFAMIMLALSASIRKSVEHLDILHENNAEKADLDYWQKEFEQETAAKKWLLDHKDEISE